MMIMNGPKAEFQNERSRRTDHDNAILVTRLNRAPEAAGRTRTTHDVVRTLY